MASEPERGDSADLLGQLLWLRRAVARTVGRGQYLYKILDAAVESQDPKAMQRARQEYERQPKDLKQALQRA